MNLSHIISPDELQWMIQHGENRQTVFMEDFDDTILEEITALANTDGGRIIVGVDSNGYLNEPETKFEQWIKKSKKIKPAVEVLPFIVVLEECIVIIFTVECSANKPCTYKGEAYCRYKNETIIMDEETQEMWRESNSQEYHEQPLNDDPDEQEYEKNEDDEEEDFSSEDDEPQYEDPEYECIPDIANVGKKAFKAIQQISKKGYYPNKTQQLIIEQLCQSPFITYQELAKKLRVHKSSIQRHMETID